MMDWMNSIRHHNDISIVFVGTLDVKELKAGIIKKNWFKYGTPSDMAIKGGGSFGISVSCTSAFNETRLK